MRALITLGILSLHAALIALNGFLPAAIGAVVAGTVYLPLWALVSLGVPVFGSAPAGGWASPSLAGWFILLFLWACLWGALVGVAAMLWRRRRSHATEA